MAILKRGFLRHIVSSRSAVKDLGMNRTQLIKLCDALVLALLVGIFASFSWGAGVVVAVLGLWLGFRFKPQRYPRTKREEQEVARVRAEDYEEFLDSGSLQNRHWHR